MFTLTAFGIGALIVLAVAVIVYAWEVAALTNPAVPSLIGTLVEGVYHLGVFVVDGISNAIEGLMTLNQMQVTLDYNAPTTYDNTADYILESGIAAAEEGALDLPFPQPTDEELAEMGITLSTWLAMMTALLTIPRSGFHGNDRRNPEPYYGYEIFLVAPLAVSRITGHAFWPVVLARLSETLPLSDVAKVGISLIRQGILTRAKRQVVAFHSMLLPDPNPNAPSVIYAAIVAKPVLHGNIAARSWEYKQSRLRIDTKHSMHRHIMPR